MKKSIDAEIKELVAGGAVEVTSGKFTNEDGTPMRIRSMESTNDPLEVGDEITIPQDFKVVAVPIGENKYPCLIAEVKSADGSERNMRFFPNSLAKNITPIDEAGRRMPKVKTTGKVASWYQEQEDVNKAMDALRNKTIVVSSVKTYTTLNYQTQKPQNTRIYEYNWKD